MNRQNFLLKMKAVVSILVIATLLGCQGQSNTTPAYVPPVYSPIPFPDSYIRSSVGFNIVANKTTTNLSYYHPNINKVIKSLETQSAWADNSGMTYLVQNSFGSSLTVNSNGFSIPTTINPTVTSFGQVSFSALSDSQLNSCGGQRCTTFMVRAYFQNQSSAGLASTAGGVSPVTINNIPIGLGVKNAVLLQRQYIPSNKSSLTQSDLTIPATYAISADFTGLAAGTYSGNLVIEYVLYKETIPAQTPPVISLSNFNSGGIYQGESSQTISWSATSSNFYYRPISLEYSKNNGSTWNLIASGLENTGSYNWVIPKIDSESALIRVSAVDLNGNTSQSVSTSPFIVDSTSPQITVNSFNNSEKFPGGGTVFINWSATDLHFANNPINLSYSADGGSTWLTIANAVPNNGQYLWQLPILDSSQVVVKVAATDQAGNLNSSNSGIFTIDSTSPTLSLLSLNGGQLIAGGSAQKILWNSSDANFSVNPIKIEYTSDNGATWAPINTSVDNSGSYLWQVPLIDSTKVKLKITSSDIVGHSTVVISANSFEIDSTAPILTLNSFNGGDYVKATTIQNINWVSSDKNLTATPITIDLSTDDGATWTNLAQGVSNSGVFNWTVPNLNTATAKIRITSVDLVGHSTIVSSTSDFSISKGTANTIQIVSGNNQTIPRSTNTTSNLRVLISDINNKPSRPGLPVTLTLLTGTGSFPSSTVFTDSDGYANAVYTSGPNIESATIKVTTQKEDLTSISVQFNIQTADFSPTSILSSLTGVLESVYFSSNDLGYSPTNSSLTVSSQISSPILGGISAVNLLSATSSSVIAPTNGVPQPGADLTNLTDQINFNLSATYPGSISSGTCQTISTISLLNNQSCSIGNTPDFSLARSSISSGTLSFRVFSNFEGPLDYKDSSAYTLKYNSIHPISNTNSGGSDGIPIAQPIIYNSKLYFSSNNSQGFSKLYSYNFNNNSLNQITNIAGSNFTSDNISEMIIYNNGLFFVAETSPGNKKLFKYCDGSTCGATSLKQISDIVSPGNDAISNLTLYNTSIYFKGMTPSGNSKLFKYCDFGLSCAGGMYQVVDINPNLTDAIGKIAIANNFLFFSAKNTSGFNKLFKYCDGNGCGSQSVSQISNIAGSTADDVISSVVGFIGNLAFSANNSQGKNKLFIYSSDTSSISQISDINTGANDNPNSLIVNGADLYFIANKTSSNQKLFKYHSGTITQLSDFLTSGSDTIQGLISYNGSIFISAKNSSNVNHLYRLNSTLNKLDQITNLNSGAGDDVRNLLLVGANLYFIGNVSGNYKMYRYCEAGSGCVF
jgi:hypothetical protein